ncbi:MAG TPA: DUF3833 domain-containing protein [Roseateles sp.]
MNRRRLLIASAAMSLAGCAGPQVQDYAQEKPVLELRAFFNGDLTAKGLFTDRAGRVVKRFTVTMKARWEGDAGVLDEQFLYSDGSTQRRVWRLKALGAGRYSGTADDVVGEAAGESAGNAFRWAYTLALPVDGRVWNVTLDDWMFLLDEGTVMNRSAMSKFGLHLGDVTLVITRNGGH